MQIDSLASILFPYDPVSAKTTIAPAGALKEHLLKDYTAPAASYADLVDVEGWKKTFMKNGFAAPTQWYTIMINGMEPDDNKGAWMYLFSISLLMRRAPGIPSERAFPPKNAPIFFGAARDDVLCVPANGYAVFKNDGFRDHDVTTREFVADHWLIHSKADEICRELESWIEEKVVKKAKI